MKQLVTRDPHDVSRVPRWTIDCVSGGILDWNIRASEICGWEDDAVHSFDDLAKLLMVCESGRPMRITLADVIELSGATGTGRQMKARLCKPGVEAVPLVLEALRVGERRRRKWLLLSATPERESDSHDPNIGALAAVVGHELNNIAVPLEGFAALASRNTMLSASDRQSFDEIRIGSGRLKGLAALLESLAETDTRPMLAPIGECMPVEVDGELFDAWSIEWLCGAATQVVVDRLHAQRAIQALARLAIGAFSRLPTGSLLTVEKGLPSGSMCVVCDAPSLGASKLVSVRAAGLRQVTRNSLRDPLGAEKGGRAVQRLTAAVLSHCAHHAGGHVFLDEASGSVSLAFTAG